MSPAGSHRSADPARRVCLLLGAGGELGDAFCRTYAHQYDIVAVGRTRSASVPSQHDYFVDPLAADTSLSDNAFAIHEVQLDLLADDAAGHVADVALARYGRIDLVVVAAGLCEPASLLDPEGASELQRHVEANVGMPVRVVRTLLERCWSRDILGNRTYGRNVVVVGSDAGLTNVDSQYSVYAVSVAAMLHAVRQLAEELTGDEIRVNAVAPTRGGHGVPIDTVTAGIVELDEAHFTGRILALESHAGDNTAQPLGTRDA